MIQIARDRAQNSLERREVHGHTDSVERTRFDFRLDLEVVAMDAITGATVSTEHVRRGKLGACSDDVSPLHERANLAAGRHPFKGTHITETVPFEGFTFSNLDFFRIGLSASDNRFQRSGERSFRHEAGKPSDRRPFAKPLIHETSPLEP